MNHNWCLTPTKTTVYEGLHAAGPKSSERVGIVGLGGLGHLAVMYAREMGCDVLFFSNSEAKKADAIALGSNELNLLSPTSTKAIKVKAGINLLLLCRGALPSFEL